MIDNGQRVPLLVVGVFDGIAGLSRGQLAFVPNLGSHPERAPRVGSLDGQPITLSDVRPAADGVTWLARYRRIG